MALFFGTAGDDYLVGGDGDDGFIFSRGNDTLIGGAGSDELSAHLENLGTNPVLPEGTTIDLAAETITGPGLTQTIREIEHLEIGDAFDVTLRGDEGANEIVLGLGTGTLFGGSGNDYLVFDDSTGVIYGEEGDDALTFFSISGPVSVSGGQGTDTLVFYDDASSVTPSVDDQGRLVLDYHDQGRVTFLDEIEQTWFFDRIFSYQEFFPILGTDTGEVMTGTVDADAVQALGGNDWILATTGADTIDGGAGTDMISFVGQDEVTINLGTGTVALNGGPFVNATTRQSVTDIENITGTSGRDHLTGDENANYIRGLGGRDIFQASGGGDLLRGGAGTDTLASNPFLEPQSQTISLLRGRIWEGEGAGTRLTGIENIIGGEMDDVFTGDHGFNRLEGLRGDDVLMGLGGDDLIYGGAGDDMAVYGFAQDHYEVSTNGGVTTVAYIGAGAGDGTDLLLSIETLRFADGDLML